MSANTLRTIDANAKALAHSQPAPRVVRPASAVASPEQSKREALHELRYAGIATIFTVLAMGALAFLQPRMTAWITQGDRTLVHPREYTATPEGGLIRYRALPEPKLTSEQRRALIAGYRHDLELLERRFRRGQFETAALPAGVIAKQRQSLRRIASNLTFAVSSTGEYAQLEIKTKNATERKVVQEYLALASIQSGGTKGH